MKEKFDFPKTENLPEAEQKKQEIVDVLYSELRISDKEKDKFEKKGGKFFKNYVFSDFIFLKHLEKISASRLIKDEERLKYKSELSKWLKTQNKRELLYGMKEYKDKLFDKFFDYQKVSKNGVIKSMYEGPIWGHADSGKWFLYQLIKDKPEDKIENILTAVDLGNSRNSMIRLAEMKVAEGLKLAEVAGDSYASLTALLGGEGTFWYAGKAGILPPTDIDVYIDKEDKVKLLDSFIKSDEKIQWLKPSSNYCTSKTYDSVFKKNEYDVFMAINYGAFADEQDLNQVAQEVLKEDKKENYRITYQEHDY